MHGSGPRIDELEQLEDKTSLRVPCGNSSNREKSHGVLPVSRGQSGHEIRPQIPH